ncbi:hypothetical protein UlMin_002923 [Ulmus minor]
MDFISGLPKSRGVDTILVVVDRLSKFAHFCGLSHPFIAKQVAEVFLREVVRLHGIPRSIVSDRDPIFMSSFWQELFRLQGTRLHCSTAYHPQSDGQTEVVNRCLETYLRCYASDKPKTWFTFLSWPYRCRSLAKRLNEKLSPRFYGPFEVLQRLKGFKGREYSGQPLPPQLTEDLELVVEPEAILQVRTAPAMQGGGKEVLVKWLSLPDWEATWEPLAAISSQFPDFNLEDKVLREEGSNDRTLEVERPPIKFVYTRRGKKVNAELAESNEIGVMGAELAGREGEEV